MNIKVAYLLLVHKEPDQVNAFLEQLSSYGDCDIYLHIDKKSSWMINAIKPSRNVYIFSEYDVRWGSFETVKAAILLMKEACRSRKDYTHIYLGSGQDLMVKKGFYEFLKSNPDKIYLKILREITKNRRACSLHRIKWPRKLMIRNDWHLYRFIRIAMQALCTAGINVLPNKKIIDKSTRFYEGWTWFIAPYDVMKYIVSYVENNPEFVDYFEDSLASDTIFFQTIIMNSEYRDSVNDTLMYIRFGKTFGTWNHPFIIRKTDNDAIEAGNFYFARKFDFNDRETCRFYAKKPFE